MFVMTSDEFEKIVAEEFPTAIPEKFRDKVKNVAFLVEPEPSPQLRMQERLGPNQTLLGHYRGIPQTSRGDYYGVGNTLPDTITLFQIPIENLARELESQQRFQEGKNLVPSGPERALETSAGYIEFVRLVIRQTIWHEVAHHFGMNEHEVREREAKRDL
jgi:predicted Zn-dependent protease with MMP-like domain